MRYLTLFLFCLYLPYTSAAEKPFKIVIPDVAPFGCSSKTGRPDCLLQQIAKKISVHAGIEIIPEVTPFPRAIKAILDNTHDLIIVPNHPLLNQHAQAVAFVFHVNLAFLTNNIDILMESAANKRVPVLRGAPTLEITNRIGNFTKIDVLHHEQMLGMFAKKRIDAVIGPREYMLAGLKRYHQDINEIYEPFEINALEAWLYCGAGACSKEVLQKLSDATQSVTQQEVDLIMADLGAYSMLD